MRDFLLKFYQKSLDLVYKFVYNVRGQRKEHKTMKKISPMYFDSMVRQTAYRNVFEVCEVIVDLKQYRFYSTAHKRSAIVSLEDYNDDDCPICVIFDGEAPLYVDNFIELGKLMRDRAESYINIHK